MSDMAEVRAEIDKIVTVFCDGGLSDLEWGRVKAAFLAAMPPGEEEIRAALRELAKSRGESECSLQVVSKSGDWLLRWWGAPAMPYSGESLVTAIRSLIPKSKPTPKENLAVLQRFLDRYARSAVHKALEGLCKQLEEKGKL